MSPASLTACALEVSKPGSLPSHSTGFFLSSVNRAASAVCAPPSPAEPTMRPVLLIALALAD
jgi:hypothetical protein